MMIDMYEIVGMVDLPKKLAGGSMMIKYEMEQVFWGLYSYLINWSAFRANNILPQADNHMVRKQSFVNRFQHKKNCV
jgi:hypothetical protein